MHTLALFGEAERGEFCTAYHCKTLVQLSDLLGEPPTKDAQGLQFAIQALLYGRVVIFFRVREEGFAEEDYLQSFQLLQKRAENTYISAIGLPGVGSARIIEATTPICSLHDSFLILTEQDLYDYLTDN